MKRLFVLACVAALALAFSCQRQTQTQPDTKAADEARLKKIDTEWSKVVGIKDVDQIVSYYAADAIVLPPDGPSVTGKDAIRDIWKEMLSAPDFAGGWTAHQVEVARSREIGYASGAWEFRWTDTSGNPAKDRGKFVEVWKKQSDGSWKCAVDIWNSDLPVPAPPEKK